MSEQGFRRRSGSLYVHSHGNLVKRQQARRMRLSVWVPVVGGVEVEDLWTHGPLEFHKREDAQRVVLDRLAQGRTR